MKKKNALTSDVRKAGISGQDEAFLDSFSDAMTNNDESNKKEFQPSEKEIDKTIKKAKAMDKSIFQEIHPEEFKKQEDEKIQKARDEKEYKEVVNQRMDSLKEEVNAQI